jgi:hypothetical protein
MQTKACIFPRVDAVLPLATLALLSLAVGPAQSDEPTKPLTTQQAWKAVERRLNFVVTDAVQGRADKNGATGHHGTMTVGTLAAAQSPGAPVAAETFGDSMTWGATPGQPPDQPAAARPGVAGCPARRTAVMTCRVPVRADLRTTGDEGDEPGRIWFRSAGKRVS